MAAIETLRDALYGNPPSATAEPSREGVLAAFSELVQSVESIANDAVAYATVADLPVVTGADNGSRARVYDDPDPDNNTYWIVKSGAWVIDTDLINALASVVQPLVDEATDAAAAAAASATGLNALAFAVRDDGSPVQSIASIDNAVWGVSAGFGGVATVADGTTLLVDNPKATIGGVNLQMQIPTGTTKIVANLYRRLMAQADALPGLASSDTLLHNLILSPADLGLTAGGPSLLAAIRFPETAVSADYSYVLIAEAFDVSDARLVIGFGGGLIPATDPQRKRGFYRPTPSSGAYSPVGGPPSGGFMTAVAAQWLTVEYIDMKAVRDDATEGAIGARQSALSFGKAFAADAFRPSDGTRWTQVEGLTRWAFGIQCAPGGDIEPGTAFDSIAALIEIGTKADSVRLRFTKRPTSSTAYPGAGPDDVAVADITRPIEDIGLEPMPGTEQRAAVEFGTQIAENGWTYMFDWTVLNATGNETAFGIARNNNVPSLSQPQRGWFDGASVIVSPFAIAWEIGHQAYVPLERPGAAIIPQGLSTGTRDRIALAASQTDGLNISVVGTFLRGLDAFGFAGDLTLEAPTSGNVTNEARTITFVYPQRLTNTTAGRLAHWHVSNVVVRDAATNDLLVEGVDYVVEPVSGGVARAAEGSARNVLVSYHWSNIRYDLICIDAETNTLVLIEGTERVNDVIEFLPKPNSATQIPLFNVRVVDGWPLEAVPLWEIEDGLHRDLNDAFQRDIESLQRACPNLLAKARGAQDIVVAAMGDSIVAMANGTPSNSSPNGQIRDRDGFFLENLSGSGLVEGLPRYDHGDGAGQVHIHESVVWALVEALGHWGSAVTYNNFCIGGTNSGVGTNNGGDAVLRAAVWATNPDALVVHYGMNQLGSTDTRPSLRNLFDDAFSRGIEVIAFGPPRPVGAFYDPLIAVRKTWRDIRAEAEFYNATYNMRAAYVASEMVSDDPWVGAIGVSPRDLSSGNTFNHYGIHEVRVYRALAPMMIAGRSYAATDITPLEAARASIDYLITQREQEPQIDGWEPVLSDSLIWAVPGETTGPAVNRKGQLFAEMPHSIGEPILSERWKKIIEADAVGNILIGVDADDRVLIHDTMPILSDSYKWVWTTEDGNILLAITADDQLLSAFTPPASGESDWSVTTRDGRVWVGKAGTRLTSLSDQAGFPADAQVIGNTARWDEFGSGTKVTTEVALTGTSQYTSSVTTVKHILTYGQSTSRGIVLPIVTVGAPVPGRLKMFSQGVSASADVALTAGSFATLADAALTNAEVPVLSAGRQYMSGKPTSLGVLVSGHGVGGYSYDQLKKGTIPYTNMVTAMRATARQHTLAGLNYEIVYLSWLHGQANSGMATGVYLSCLVEIQANLTADYHTMVGTYKEIVFITSQVSNFTAYSLTQAPPMTLELLEASILYPDKFVCAGPEYPVDYNDSTHFTSAGSLHIGELHGRAMREHEAGLYRGPLYVKTAVRTAATVVLTFNDPYGGAPIDLFTGVVSDPGNYGVTFHQTGGSAVTVTGVAEGPGDFQLTITLSATPTGTDQKIGIAATGTSGQPAGPTTGGRSCIRSAVSEVDAEGVPLDHYACHQFIAIT